MSPVLTALVLAAVLWPAAVRAADLTISGTGSSLPLMELLVGNFSKIHPEIEIKLIRPPLGSGGSIRALAADKIDLAVLGRDLKPKEERSDFHKIPWARTPTVLATSNGKLAGGLDLPTLADILSRGRPTWDDGARINLVLRIPQETDMMTLAALSPGVAAALERSYSDLTVVIADTDLEALDLLGKTTGSLGTTTLGLMRLENSTLQPLDLNGVSPSVESVADGSYPMAKTLSLLYKGEPGPELDALLDWLVTPGVAAVLHSYEHLPLF